MLPTNPLLSATAPAGPHLPAALLRQYAAGTLAPAAQHRVEAHTLACARCADVLDGLLQTPPATTDQALAQLQQRLRQRVQQQAAPARLVRDPRQHRWLVPQLAAAAALLFGLLAGGWWAWQQRHLEPASPAPVAVLKSVPPAPTSAVPAAAPAVAVPASPALPTPPLAARPARAALAAEARHSAASARHQRPTPSTAGEESAAAAPPATADAPAVAAAPAATVAVPTPPDTTTGASKARKVAVTKSAPTYDEAARVRVAAMPAGPALAPAPVGGYAALREKLRQEAVKFTPEAPDRPLSGSVQLRLTIGPDGKIQQIDVLRGLRDDYDAEAQRLVCDGPAWVPGVSGGHRAAQAIMVTVPF